jgi:hypothetical protein
MIHSGPAIAVRHCWLAVLAEVLSLITAASLKSYTAKDLAQMAKQRGIAGWHSMRKEQLVQALLKTVKPERNGKSAAKAAVKSKSSPRTSRNATSRQVRRRPTVAQRKIRAVHAARENFMDLSLPVTAPKAGEHADAVKDRLVLMVRDSYWLHAYWELSARVVERAQAALGARWHAARPVLRLLEVGNVSVSNCAEQVVRVINIHGAVKNWYIDVQDPPKTYRVEIGYLTADSDFHVLAHSNVVTTPRPGSTDVVDGNWEDVMENSDRIYAMSGGFDSNSASGELQELFEERLRRPLGSPMVTRFGNGAEGVLGKERGLQFKIDSEMIVYGMTDPDAFVTMSGEPIRLAPDGSFRARVSLPDRRQIIPVVASSGDGVEEQTIVLAVERNTKVMEPKIREPGE